MNSEDPIVKKEVLGNGETIAYVEFGQQYKNQGPTWLFIHGFCDSKEAWEPAISFLKNGQYHIIAVDLRGYGDSTYNQKCDSIQNWAEDLVDFCGKKGINQCVAIGWSNGGIVSMKFAELAPKLVTKIILTCSVAIRGLDFSGHQTQREQLANQNVEASMKQFKTFIPENSVYTLKESQLRRWVQGSLKMNRDCFEHALKAMAEPKINAEKITAKGLVIHGEKDPIIILEDEKVKESYEYFEKEKKFKIKIMKDMQHAIPFEDPKTFTEDIKQFIMQKE